jgi:hypothetical protein
MNTLRIAGTLLVLFLLIAAGLPQDEVYFVRKGSIRFVSDAPLETIRGVSNDLKGVIDAGKRTFAFTVPNRSIHGFNSPLQQEHFYENYIEGDKYPASTFEGKIIEEIDFTKNGEYTVRAKGLLNIHGVPRERIIKSTLLVENGSLLVTSRFTVLLEEHKITIPKIVYQKIAEEITVSVDAEFTLKTPPK